MLSEYEFITVLDYITKGLEQRDKFDKAMSEFNTSFYVTNIGDDWLTGLIFLLEIAMNDKPGKNGSYISWWLFNSNVVDKIITIIEEDGTSYEIPVKTPHQLYKFLSERKVD